MTLALQEAEGARQIGGNFLSFDGEFDPGSG
jgi:hypothetical protein